MAIRLFNERGIHAVSIRDIGGALEMSSGNFAYHFKNKEALIEYFYHQMYDEVEIATELNEDEGFPEFQNILMEITRFMTKYSFFYTDIVDIFRSCPAIRKDYAHNYEGRKSIYKGFLHHFISKSLISIPNNEQAILDRITHAIWFNMTFWQSQKKVLPAHSPQIQPEYVINQIWQIILPYMTHAGRADYEKLKS